MPPSVSERDKGGEVDYESYGWNSHETIGSLAIGAKSVLYLD